jgi:hypothetical protein
MEPGNSYLLTLVKGFHQRPVIDYYDTFCPVIPGG